MFSKLNIQLDSSGWEQLNKQVDFGEVINGKFMGITYYNLHFPQAAQLYNLVPERFRKDFYLSLLRITDSIPAHTDSHDRAVINFYIQPDGCVTQFYKLLSEQPSLSQIKNMTDGHIFKEAELEKVGEFTAKPNDVYLLNTKAVHSVTSTKPNLERLAIQLGTGEHSYNDVKDMLNVV